MAVYKNENGQVVKYAGSSSVIIDSALSSGSTNPIQNKAVKEKFDSVDSAVSTNTTDIASLKNNKVDKVSGKGLSTNDYTTSEKTKLGSLNSTLLNKLGTTSEGKLTYDGSEVNEIITVDSTLSKESMNPIQNKVVAEALDTKPDVFVYPFCTESDTWSSDTLQSYEGSTVSLYSTPIDYDKVRTFLNSHTKHDFIVNVMFDYNTIPLAYNLNAGLCNYCKMDVSTGIIKVYTLNNVVQNDVLSLNGKLFIIAVPTGTNSDTIIDGVTNAIFKVVTS